jgi:hypothetical protein
MLSPRLALRWSHVLLVLGMATLFIYFNYTPLYHTDVWGHVHWGQKILEMGQLPTEDPFMPLAAGVREIDTAWLSQVAFALTERAGGDEALSNLYAFVLIATYGIYLRVFYLQSGRLSLAVLGMVGVFLSVLTRNAIIRPEIFGGLCFALLLWMLVYREPWRSSAAVVRVANASRTEQWHWLGIFLLFAVWVNLHGSFAAGLVVLLALSLGTCVEAAWRAKSVWAVFTNRPARHSILQCELALVATLCNPYGFDLLLATLHFGSNPNLNEILEWYPLRFIDLEGILVSATLLLVMFCLRQSKRRIHLAEGLIFLSLIGMTFLRVRMINWYGPMVFFLMIPHAASVWRRAFGKRSQRLVKAEELTTRHFAPTLVSGLILWMAFSLSPSSKPVLGGEARRADRLYSQSTPVEATNYLLENQVSGLILAPQWWGDWFALHGPADSSVFMTTHIHLAPRRVWTDYLTVARGQSGWPGILNKYSVGTLIVHKQLQPILAAQVRGSADWQAVYEDELAMIVQRTN